MKSCTSNNACAICFVHRDHRSEYVESFEQFTVLQQIYNTAPLLRLFFNTKHVDEDTANYLTNAAEHELATAIGEKPAGRKRKKPDWSTLGQGSEPLLHFSASDIVYDELHLMLRVMDRLLSGVVRAVEDDDHDRKKLEEVLREVSHTPGLHFVEQESKNLV